MSIFLFILSIFSLFTTHFRVLVFAILTVNEVIAKRLPGNAAPLWTREVIPTEISTIKVSSVICQRREICWNKNRTTDKQFIVVQFDIFSESCRLSYRTVMFSWQFDNDSNVLCSIFARPPKEPLMCCLTDSIVKTQNDRT